MLYSLPLLLVIAQNKQLVADTIAVNKKAIESIKTMEGRYRRERYPDASGEIKINDKLLSGTLYKHWLTYSPGQFWRHEQSYRIKFLHQPKVMADYSVIDFRERKALSLAIPQNGMKPSLGRMKILPQDGEGGLLWQWLLFTHWGQGQQITWSSWEDLLKIPHEIELKENGNGLTHIRYSHDRAIMDFWFDQKTGLVKKRQIVPIRHKEVLWEDEVLEWASFPSDVCVPTVVEHRFFKDGVPDGALRTIITDLKVNHPMDVRKTLIPGIAGMTCYDMVDSSCYTADSSGNAVGPITHYDFNPPPSTPPEEKGSSYRFKNPWMLAISICGMMLLFIVSREVVKEVRRVK